MSLVTLLNFDGGRRSVCGKLLGEHPCRGIWQTVKLVDVGGKLLLLVSRVSKVQWVLTQLLYG